MITESTSKHPTVLLEAFSTEQFTSTFRFEGLESVVVAHSLDEVVPALAAVEYAVDRGKYAAGFVSYEAATGLNSDLPLLELPGLPLVWFGIFAERITCAVGLDEETGDCTITSPELDISHETYVTAIDSIRNAIAAGETYQVNYTTRQRFNVAGDPFTLYRKMCRNQQAPFCAWIDTGSQRILSASPELFFALDNDRITMKPMKGTAPRIPHGADDRHRRDLLAASEKERAENLMIVDLVRNDLATIAQTGSVAVSSLFDVETYPTVHQMTSTVTAKIRPEIGLADIFRALFPCGSVTGAPKRRTMEIISQMEAAPRGIYCGAIGYVSPGREAVFSVAIRTAVVETVTGRAEIGIGSGITWDSVAESEFQECLTKSAFLHRDSSAFQLIETLRYDRKGYLLLDRHLQRLAESAAYFGFSCDNDTLRSRLAEHEQELSGIHKVRVQLTRSGNFTIESQPISTVDPDAATGRIAVSRQRVYSLDTFLYHKTSRRALYDDEIRNHPTCYDVLFLNEKDELTEGSYNTIVISLNGDLLTPALNCGLLPGVLREELLEVGAIREAVLTLDDLYAADTIWLVNSVRGWRECIIAKPATLHKKP